MAERPRLFIDVQHGLANRMRAWASAAVIAERTGRQLVLVWRPDAHCQARVVDLFDYDGPVIEDASANLFRKRSSLFVTLMEIEPGGRVFAQLVLPDPEAGDVYIRSAYVIASPYRDASAERRFLRALRPAEAVRARVASVTHPSTVAAHIRMATGPGFDHLPHEAPDNWPAERHEELAAWRHKSHVQRFIPRLDRVFADDPRATIFIAADLPETYELLAARYGPQLRWQARSLYGREAMQIQSALADVLLLARADLFLSSTWSSFSDMAQILAPAGRPLERSGFDF